MEGIFEAQVGVIEAKTGYIGGEKESANYETVSTGKTLHREGIQVMYNPEIISFSTLVELFWTQIDPTDSEGQFADKWLQYTTAIYYSTQEEKAIIEKSKIDLENAKKFEKEIATQILPVSEFFEAEEEHQNYYKNSSFRYNLYKKWSGRSAFIESNWESRIQELSYTKEADLKKKLSPLQYKVTQEAATEPPFQNEYWENDEEGIYVDIVDGTPLFSSQDKYDAGCGWPSFTQPINGEKVKEFNDYTLSIPRVEVRSSGADSHLWHVFNDGPNDTWWLRYCINSASLKFIPLADLEEEWYGEYVKLFQ